MKKFFNGFLILVLFVVVSCNTSNDDVTEEPDVPFTVSSYYPDTGKVDSELTIVGSNFSTVLSEIEVRFNSTEAAISSASTNEIKAIVPSNLPTGETNVTLTINGETKPVGAFSVTVDDYKYLVFAKNLDRLYTIGNISGSIEEIGELNLSPNNPLTTNSITNTENKIYAIGNGYQEEENYLIIYDKDLKVTEEILLTIPNSIPVVYPYISCMEWDSQNARLIGLLNTNVLNNTSDYHLITINPSTYAVEDLGAFNIGFSTGIGGFTMVNDTFYLTDLGFYSVDLNTVEVTNYDFGGEHFYRLTKSNTENSLYGLRSTSNSGLIPVKIDMEQVSFTDLHPGGNFTQTASNGKAFYDSNSNRSVTIIGNDTEGYSLYKFNDVSEEKIDLEYQFGTDILFFVIGIE